MSEYIDWAEEVSAMASEQHQQYSNTDTPFEIESDDADGEKLAARYQMLEELGSGSFGVVYKAIERATGEIVAIKHVSDLDPCPSQNLIAAGRSRIFRRRPIRHPL